MLYRTLIEGKLLFSSYIRIHHFLTGRAKSKNQKRNQMLKKWDATLSRPFRKRVSERHPVEDDVILFIAFQGSYTCNPRAVAEECIRRGLPYKMYWTILKGQEEDEYPEQLILVRRGSKEFYEAAAKAKVIVDNAHDLPRLGVCKKQGQILMQTWHGSLGIKRLDGAVVRGKEWDEIAEKSRMDTDFCISNSTFEDEVFQTSYWTDVPILKYGHARNDILFERDEKVLQHMKAKVCDALDMDHGAKIALYAPTHYDGDDIMPFSLDYAAVRKALQQRFGGEWYLLVRLHKRQKKLSSKMELEDLEGVVDATYYPDIQDLILVTDFGLTDYSSWIFDYVLLKRPGAIIAADLQEFKEKRDFYYPIEEVPFPIAESNPELVEYILQYDMDGHPERTEEFLQKRGCMDDGHASERIVDKISEIMTRAE